MHKSLHAFVWLLAVCVSLFAFSVPGYSGNKMHPDNPSWATEHLFEHRVLIENKGQFDGKDPLHSSPILYGARCGGVDLYFNQQGVCFRKDVYKKLDEEDREKVEQHPGSKKAQALTKPEIQLLEAEWIGSNPLSTITAEDLQTTSFHYPAAGNKTLIAAAYKKIIYHDLYPHIDVEYILPNNKEGIKYSIIVHPGADLSKVSLKYSGDMSLTPLGDLSVKSDFGDLCDHAPVAWYDANHQAVKSCFQLKNGALTFLFPNGYDHSRKLVIDPWTTDPAFTTYDAGYDLESDNNGNIYVYGSFSPFQLEKFGPGGGAPLWVYNATSISYQYYGDLATDETSGTTYLVEGWNSGFGGARVIKVNANGVQTGIFPGNAGLDEMWRADYDACDKMIVIGCGGTSGQQQTAILDTNMVNITPANSINTVDNGYHDISLLAIDPSGGACYMATTQSLTYPGNFNNVMFKVPLPAMVPATFLVADLNDLHEFNQLNYVGGVGFTEGYNGFNGMACSLNFLYTYNGDTLRKWNKTTGAFIAYTTTGGTMYQTGGLAVDVCDHVYAGAGTVIKEYDVNLNPIGNFAVSNTVYDVKLGANSKLLACGIQFVQQIDLAALAPLQVTTSVTPSGCSCSGTATATTTLCGNPTTVIYSWSPGGQTTATATGLCPGTYTVSATPSCALTPTTATVVITTAAGSLSLTTAQTNVTCHGGNNGSATVTATGVAPYTYSWSPSGGTGATASGLTAGTYTANVTDNSGCSGSSVVTITQPTAVTASNVPVNVSCHGGTNGSITVTAGGGTGAYTYSWEPVGGAGSSATGLGAGTYTCTVTDANNCAITTTGTITQPTAITLTTTSTPATCGSANGGATVTPTGGTGAYTYSWSPGGNTTSNPGTFTAGTYTVQVTDANGCIQTATVVVATSGGLTVTATSTNVSCNGGSNGTTTATPAGGTAPYTYSWSPAGGTAATATGLPAGTYTITLSDANGCSNTTTATITQPTVLSATNSQVNDVCNGGTTGSATASPAGGTGAYTYSWSPSGGTAATASGLAAGTYTCTIHDANNCSTTTIVTITQPAAVTATNTTVSATCGGSDGSATVTAGGGTPGYTYSWSPTGATTATVTGVPSGSYTCTVTDSKGCIITTTANVGNLGGPVITPGPVTNITCFGLCNGSASVHVTGGTGALTYSWTPSGGTSANATALCVGSYTCTVTDANGCNQAVVIPVTQPTAVVLSIPSSTNVLCNGGSNGSATASASGGTGTLTYAWTPTGGNSAVASNLSVGLYTVVVTDANGCSQQDTITIHQPAALAINAAGVSTTCNNKCDGQLICIPTGGTTPYTYSWNTGCTAPSCNGVCAGIDSIMVTDAHGCTIRDTATVHQPLAIHIAMNPVAAFCSQSNGSACASVTGGTGADTYSWLPAAPGSLTSCYNHIPPGTYTVVVHDANNCPDSNTVVVGNRPGVTVSIPTSTDPSCNAGLNGTATALAVSGTQPYTYAWAPSGGTAATAAGLGAGTYTCTVRDSAGCTASATVVLGQPAPVVVSPMPTTTICIGQCVVLTATGAGGTPGYTYTWTLNGTGVISPVCPVVTSTYTVIATDANGCVSLPATVPVTVNPPLEVVTAGKSICPGFSDSLQAIATGGSGVYSYTWIPAIGLSSTTIPNPVATPAVTSTYTVIVSDNCGTPTDSAIVTVTLYPAPLMVFAANDTAGCAPLCVSFTAVSNPACASSTWNFGDGTTGTGCSSVTHCYTTPGLYSVSQNITDINGCKANLNINNYIDVWPLPTAAFTLGPQPTTIVEPLITFTDHSTSVGGIASWAWSFGDFPGGTSSLQNPQYAYQDTGCFTVTLFVKNHFGCVDSTSNPLCIHPDFVFYAPNAFTPNGDGKNDRWTPEGVGIDPATYHMFIFDRWGNLIWETRTWGQAWDGRANGGTNVAQIDTYIWKCEVSDYLGNAHKYVGHCSIIK